MKTRSEVIEYCLKFEKAYEDYPFSDPNWTVMRRIDTKKGFAWIFERDGNIWLNLKIEPSMRVDLQENYKSIVPAYHMNKIHWTSIILDGTVPGDVVEALINTSYKLCGK